MMKENRQRCHVLVCCSGSVATVKIPELTFLISQFAEVRIVCSGTPALFFLSRSKSYNKRMWNHFSDIGGYGLIISDWDEWNLWSKIGDPVLHIEIRRWADLVVVVPASANTLSKIAHGNSDSLLLSVLRAWDVRSQPCIVCPAMNTLMWEHPSTSEACDKLKSWGWKIIYPQEKKLACDDVGKGGLAPVSEIVEAIKYSLDMLEVKNIYNGIVPFLRDDWQTVSNLKKMYYKVYTRFCNRDWCTDVTIVSIGIVVGLSISYYCK